MLNISQWQIFCAQQHAGGTGGQYTRHNLHRTSHTEKETQRADCLPFLHIILGLDNGVS